MPSRFRTRIASRAGARVILVAAMVLAACNGEEAADPATATAAVLTPATTEAGAPTAAAPAGPISVVDYAGDAVTLEAPARAIVSYSPGATEVLFAIGAGDRVVGVDRFSDFPAGTAALPQLEYSNPDPEAALALEPDLVILAARQSEQVGQFRGAGMTVFYAGSADALEQVYEQIATLGRLTGREEAAAGLVSDMQARIEAVTAQLADVERGPRVFFELTADLYTVAPDSFVGALLEALKAQNIAAGAASQFPQLTAEAVVAADPEVILLADAEFGESLQSLRARPGWEVISAVANERVVAIDPDVANRPGPRLAVAIEQMARALYPDRFP